MAAFSRTVYGREFVITPTWLWVTQGASGLLLGPLTAFHIWAPGMAQNRALNALLLIAILVHGFSGLSRMANGKQVAMGYKVIAMLWSLIVLLLGSAVVLA
ncbi:MAG: hypothetical protein HY525_05435 [Betaproteobacteria bacterium]|nr:hypothetical protein [Betaproteobacteria bacterium]